VADVREPSRPRQLARVDDLFLASVTAREAKAYAASQQGYWRPPVTPLPFRVDSPAVAQSPEAWQDDPHPFNGLVIFDMARPTNPEEASRLELDGTPEHVAVTGSSALVATGASGLQIVDVNDIESPYVTGRYTDTFGNANAVAASGDLAYVAIGAPPRAEAPDGNYGALSVLDVHAAGGPVEVGRMAMPERLTAVSVKDDYCVVVDANSITLIDVSDPTKPTWLDRFVPSDADPGLTPVNISVRMFGDYTYAGVNPASLFVLELVEGPPLTPSPEVTRTPTSTSPPTEEPTATPTVPPTVTPEAPPEIYLPIAER
jgi:hypothetical protein